MSSAVAVGKRNKERGKEVERAMANTWGAERVSHKSQGEEVDDLRWPADAPSWSIEAKRWSPQPPAWIRRDIDEAEAWYWDEQQAGERLAGQEIAAYSPPAQSLRLGVLIHDGGGRGAAVSGYWRTHTSYLHVSVKRNPHELPQRLIDALDQADDNCPADLNPIVVLHAPRAHYASDLVVMRYACWRDLYGEFVGQRRWEMLDGGAVAHDDRPLPLPDTALVVTRARWFIDHFGV